MRIFLAGICGVTAALLFAGAATAQEQRFGEWIVGALESGSGLYAATSNDSRGVFGQYCYFNQSACAYVFTNNVDCDEGAKYQVLVNASTGAEAFVVTCRKVEGRARYVFAEDFDDIDDIVQTSIRIGIAFPLENGEFTVSRWLMDGSKDAVNFMRGAAERVVSRKPAAPTIGTRDTRI